MSVLMSFDQLSIFIDVSKLDLAEVLVALGSK